MKGEWHHGIADGIFVRNEDNETYKYVQISLLRIGDVFKTSFLALARQYERSSEPRP